MRNGNNINITKNEHKRTGRTKQALLLLLILLFFGCMSAPDDTTVRDTGLPSMSLGLSSEDYNNIYKTSYVNEWIYGRLGTSASDDLVKLRRQGKSSRRYPKPSFKSVGSQETAVYSAQYYDKSFSRYYLADYLFRKAGFDTPELTPIVLTINDQFHGLYLKREVIDQEYFEKRGLSVRSLYKVNHGVEFTFKKGMVTHAGFEKKIPHGDLCYTDLEQFIVLLDSWDSKRDQSQTSLEDILDIKNVLDYYAISVLLNNYDCITYNFYFAFNSDKGKFQFVPWDLDRTFRNLEDTLPVYENGLFEKLLEVPEYEAYVEKRKRELFNPAELKEELAEFHQEIAVAYELDPYLPGNLNDHKIELERYIDSVEQILLRSQM